MDLCAGGWKFDTSQVEAGLSVWNCGSRMLERKEMQKKELENFMVGEKTGI